MNPIDVFKEAGSQFRKCAVPTVIAVTAGAVIAKLGIPIVSLGLAAACAVAYVRGYRIHIGRRG